MAHETVPFFGGQEGRANRRGAGKVVAYGPAPLTGNRQSTWGLDRKWTGVGFCRGRPTSKGNRPMTPAERDTLLVDLRAQLDDVIDRVAEIGAQLEAMITVVCPPPTRPAPDDVCPSPEPARSA